MAPPTHRAAALFSPGAPGSAPPPPRLPARALAVGAAILAVLAIATCVSVYASIGAGDDLAAYDRPVLDFFAAHRAGWATPIVAAATRIGSAPILSAILLVLLACLCWPRRSLYPLLLEAAAAALAVLLTVFLKNALDRERPPYDLAIRPFETSGSFPSGHTLNSTALTLVLVYLVARFARSRTILTLACVLGAAYIVGIGLTRLYLGAHWLTDVVGGWALGLAVACLVVVLDVVLARRAARRAPGPPPAGGGPGSTG